jgi:hypothetical protein
VFNELVATSALMPGCFYVTDKVLYLARTRNTFYTYGGASVQEIVNELLQRESFCTELIEGITANETFINVLAQTIIGSATFQDIVAQILLSDLDFRSAILQAIANILTREFIVDVLSDALSVVAPDGSRVATNDGGKLTLQLATNDKFGIVKGQANTSPTTWHNVHATNGMLSINREQVEVVMDGKDTQVKNSINVRAEDNCIVGRNENGTIVLPIRYAENEPVSPADGTMYLVKENASNP